MRQFVLLPISKSKQNFFAIFFGTLNLDYDLAK